MKSLNRFTCIGNIGTLGELKFVGENKVIEFSVAINRKDKNGETTEWVSCVAWNRLAENVNAYLGKGDGVYVEGELRTRSWEKDGQKHYKTEILVRDLSFLSKSSKGERTDAPRPSHSQNSGAVATAARLAEKASPSSAFSSREDGIYAADDLPF